MQALAHTASTETPPSIGDVAVKAAVRVVKAWRLTAAEAATLLAVSPRTFARMKDGTHAGDLNQDQLTRVSALVGLYKGLHLYFDDDLANRWPRLPNTGPLFSGQTPVAYMQERGLPALLEVRAYVDAIRGGV